MTPSPCSNCGFASLFLDPFLLSRMPVSEGRCLGHLRLGNGPNGQALPHCGTCSSLRGAFSVLPVAELLQPPCGGCQNISRLPQATEYQEYLAGAEKTTVPKWQFTGQRPESETSRAIPNKDEIWPVLRFCCCSSLLRCWTKWGSRHRYRCPTACGRVNIGRTGGRHPSVCTPAV